MSVISLDSWRERLENTSVSKSQSSQNTKSDKTGPTPTSQDDELEDLFLQNILFILEHARQRPFTTKSDVARKLATEVAVCAVDGLITTRVNDDTIGNVWMITSEGLDALQGLR